jgi:hypothetical protein
MGCSRSGGVRKLDPDFPNATWRAVIARLIPSDDAPGALDAGVDQVLLAQGHGPIFADWLIALNAATAPGLAFPELDESTQDAWLQRVEAGEIPPVSGELFAGLVSLVAEAFYSSPSDTSPDRTTPAWTMLGYVPRPQPSPSSLHE